MTGVWKKAQSCGERLTGFPFLPGSRKSGTQIRTSGLVRGASANDHLNVGENAIGIVREEFDRVRSYGYDNFQLATAIFLGEPIPRIDKRRSAGQRQDVQAF